MFYITDPAETSFPDMASLPTPYLAQAAPFFFSMIALEWIILILKGEKIRLNDGIFSVAHGLIMSLMEWVDNILQISQFSNLSLEHLYLGFSSLPTFISTTTTAFTPFHGTQLSRGSLLQYALTSSTTGCTEQHMVRVHYICNLAFADLYVTEVNLLWAAHQVHHSSEDYNTSTALRQSAFQTFGGWVTCTVNSNYDYVYSHSLFIFRWHSSSLPAMLLFIKSSIFSTNSGSTLRLLKALDLLSMSSTQPVTIEFIMVG